MLMKMLMAMIKPIETIKNSMLRINIFNLKWRKFFFIMDSPVLRSIKSIKIEFINHILIDFADFRQYCNQSITINHHYSYINKQLQDNCVNSGPDKMIIDN